MRIIAGEAGGRRIFAPKGEGTRPTLDRVKESLFGIIQLHLTDAVVLDLYAGSGNLGLEALSRGAGFSVFNDYSRDCCALIKKNIEALGYSERSEIINMDALGALKILRGARVFDIVFLDAPYLESIDEALSYLFRGGLVNSGGLVIAEHDIKRPPGEIDGLMRCTDRRKYGGIGLSFFAGI